MTIKNCLVTGGSGYVGQRLANLLTIKGYNVRILSRKKNISRLSRLARRSRLPAGH